MNESVREVGWVVGSVAAVGLLLGSIIGVNQVQENIYSPVDVISSPSISGSYLNDKLTSLTVYESKENEYPPYVTYSTVVHADDAVFRKGGNKDNSYAVIEKNLNGRYRVTLFSKIQGKVERLNRGSISDYRAKWK